MQYLYSSFILLITIILISQVVKCEQKCKQKNGCKIVNKECVCRVGCYSEYKYNSREECNKALKVQLNPCESKPCLHDGVCIQTHQESRGYRCNCPGTGYYGKRCQFACPTAESDTVGNYPYECIII